MTAKELAEMLSGREAGEELTWGEEQDIKGAGLVVVYGYSDDNVEFCGAINDEVGAYEGVTIPLTKDGVLRLPMDDCDECSCPYIKSALASAKSIKAVWHDEEGPCWTLETDIPHETFTIVEDGEPFCEGIVFGMADLEVTV